MTHTKGAEPKSSPAGGLCEHSGAAKALHRTPTLDGTFCNIRCGDIAGYGRISRYGEISEDIARYSQISPEPWKWNRKRIARCARRPTYCRLTVQTVVRTYAPVQMTGDQEAGFEPLREASVTTCHFPHSTLIHAQQLARGQ